MTFAPSNSEQNFISTDINLTDDESKNRLILRDKLKRIIESLDQKEIGQYDTVELMNGENWFDPTDNNVMYDGIRKVINIEDPGVTTGLLDHGGGVATQTQPHGITTTANTRFTHVYGIATNPGASTLTQSIPIPYVDVDALAGGIELFVDATNVNLRYGANYSAFTTAYVILEWIENV